MFAGAGFEVEEGGLRDDGRGGGGGGGGFDGEFGGGGAGGDAEVLEGEDEVFLRVVVVGVGVGTRKWSGVFEGGIGDVAVAFEAEEMG